MTMHDIAPAIQSSRTLRGPAAYMCGLTWDGTHLWHSDQGAEKIFAVDRSDGRVVRTLSCGWVRADLTYDGSMLCQVGGRPKRLVLVDPATGEVAGQKRVAPPSGRLTGLEMAPEGLWMCLRGPAVVQLRDYATMAMLREYPARGSAPSGLTYVDGVVVYGDFHAGTLSAMAADTGHHLGEVAVPGHPTGLTWDGEHLWYCDFSARQFRALPLPAVTP